MNHILMSWNPCPANDATWDPIKFEDFLVVPFLAGKITRTRWSVGRNRNNIGPGDRRFLPSRGVGPRNCCARRHPLPSGSWQTMGG